MRALENFLAFAARLLRQFLHASVPSPELSVTFADLFSLLKRKVIVQFKGILTIASKLLSQRLHSSSRALNHRQ